VTVSRKPGGGRARRDSFQRVCPRPEHRDGRHRAAAIGGQDPLRSQALLDSRLADSLAQAFLSAHRWGAGIPPAEVLARNVPNDWSHA
jgi:hypothetical protein